MRVTNAATYRNFTTSVNNVHLTLNRSMNKISSGELYENAAESPLSYYEGKRMDTQYQDAETKKTLLKDVQNRIYQQELGVRNIQTLLSQAKNNVQYANTATTTDTALDTTKSALLQQMHEVVNTLNTQYENFYVYGGNDVSTPPFSLSADGSVLTYRHKFSDEDEPTEFQMELKQRDDGSYGYELLGTDKAGNALGTEKDLVRAMREQGRVDIGYGSIQDKSTLLDTYTGGMNVLTGITSDAIRTWKEVTTNGKVSYEDSEGKTVMDYLSEGPLALIGRSVQAIDKYLESGKSDRGEMSALLGDTITDMTVSEHSISSFYADLGNKYRLIDDMDNRLGDLMDSLKISYKEKLGADPYESIMEMYNNNYAYNAALQVGSRLMSSSLFDFMG